jgi:hypothetical protein
VTQPITLKSDKSQVLYGKLAGFAIGAATRIGDDAISRRARPVERIREMDNAAINKRRRSMRKDRWIGPNWRVTPIDPELPFPAIHARLLAT